MEVVRGHRTTPDSCSCEERFASLGRTERNKAGGKFAQAHEEVVYERGKSRTVERIARVGFHQGIFRSILHDVIGRFGGGDHKG